MYVMRSTFEFFKAALAATYLTLGNEDALCQGVAKGICEDSRKVFHQNMQSLQDALYSYTICFWDKKMP